MSKLQLVKPCVFLEGTRADSDGESVKAEFGCSDRVTLSTTYLHVSVGFEPSIAVAVRSRLCCTSAAVGIGESGAATCM